jgi:hypothetical protein
MADDKECMYVFDGGLVTWITNASISMTDEGYFFLSRLRRNAVIREVESFKIQTIPLFYPTKWFGLAQRKTGQKTFSAY